MEMVVEGKPYTGIVGKPHVYEPRSKGIPLTVSDGDIQWKADCPD
jgi:hypothetical protein